MLRHEPRGLYAALDAWQADNRKRFVSPLNVERDGDAGAASPDEPPKDHRRRHRSGGVDVRDNAAGIVSD